MRPTEGAAAARHRDAVAGSLVGLALAAVVALVPSGPLRLAVLVGLVGGTWLLRSQESAAAWTWAALIPIATRLAWASLFPEPAASLASCADPFSATAVNRAVETAVVLGTLAVVARWMGSSRADLGLRWPATPVVVLSVAAVVVLAPVAVVVGPLLAEPFFGRVATQTGDPLAIVPALLLAGSNAAMEELSFRGALLGWGARSLGSRGALVAQAALFGLVHVGPDFVTLLAAIPVMLGVAIGGLVAGVIVRRTGSLLLPVAAHTALDVPIYYAFACRLP
jgi:membrane protease YdiL (CAAX protease family)